MAICRSHLFSQMVGSVAGITYFHNRYATIVARNRVKPTDPASGYQTTRRTYMSAAVSAWQALTNAQRETWEFYASGTPWTNALGDEVRLTGMNMYIAVRLSALTINPTMNTALLNEAHCIPGMNIDPEISFSACSGGGAGFKVDIVNPHPTDNMRVGIQISTAQRTSVNFWKGPYDPANYVSTASIPAGFGTSVEYKTLTSGARYFLRIRGWNNTLKTLVSNPMYFHCDASACP